MRDLEESNSERECQMEVARGWGSGWVRVRDGELQFNWYRAVV